MTRLLLRGAVATAAVLTLAAVLAAGLRGGAGSELPGVGAAAPALVGTTLEGEPLDLSGLRGSVVVVNVWASWCGPCRDELPLLVEAGERWSGDGLQVVGIVTRDRDGAARDLLASAGGGFPSVRDPDGRLALSWGALGVPETFVVDRSGVVRARLVGPLSDGWLEAHAVPLLGT